MESRSWRAHTGALLTLMALFTGIEIVFVGKIDAQETPVGFGVALVAAIVTAAALRLAGARYHIDPRWLHLMGKIARDVLRDTAIVSGVLLRRLLRGTLPDDAYDDVPLDAGGYDPESAARRALVVAAASAAPNTVALDIDRASGTMRVHRLVPASASPPRSLEWPL